MYETKGTDIMDNMLLNQYNNSPNLKEYFGAYIKEMDLLFRELEACYFGRLLDNAVGEQLDIIGRILQQSRNLQLSGSYFGFVGAFNADGFGTTGNTSIGGVFKSEEDSGYITAPLDDTTYRNVLRARGFAISKDVWSIEDMYTIIKFIVPNSTILLVTTSTETILTLQTSIVTTRQQQILEAIKHWFVPVGLIFTIILQ